MDLSSFEAAMEVLDEIHARTTRMPCNCSNMILELNPLFIVETDAYVL